MPSGGTDSTGWRNGPTISGAGVTLVEELDLWDMPAIFLLMLVLMAAEWGYRRVRGLV